MSLNMTIQEGKIIKKIKRIKIGGTNLNIKEI